ncbi:unnamed protein product [Ilex paraguariensis]|uniref:Cysteine-rich receptor-like protein kinase n=1 Tax=Ilex paraguariensis TaxID=185542 RepID=A0ABC8TSR4_9AQUA
MGYWKLLFFAFHILTSFHGLCNGQPDFRAHVCGDNGTTSMYESNKNTLLSSVAPNIGRNGFYNSSVGQNSDRVNAIALCRGDVELDICRSCVNDSTHKLVQLCPNYHGAIGWYDKCMLRFSNYTIFHQLDIGPERSLFSLNNVSDSDVPQFNQALRLMLDRLREKAKSGDSLRKFASERTSGPAFQTIYALSQCTPDLSDIQCYDCLDGAAKAIPYCCNGRQGGRVLRPSCNLRFETERFYNETPATPQPPPGKDSSTTRTVIIIVVPIVISVILIIMFICIFQRKRKHRKPTAKIETMDEISSIETLRYDFGAIRIATDNFSDSNQLGQGGFGVVYKGTLPNGKEIAVKRLSRDSGQGEQEFKNEVLLVVKLQHKNLVRLLGFSLEGTEKLLVYEFMPNASLDHFLFGMKYP